MDSVSKLNQVVLLLRQQLLERASGARPAGATRAAARQSNLINPSAVGDGSDPLARLVTVRKAGVTDGRILSRLLIEQILSMELGSQSINDAGFQCVVDQVMSSLRSDPVLSELLDTLVRTE